MTFRSLPRPSSAISALAFTLCPYMLDLLRTPSLPAIPSDRSLSLSVCIEPLRSRRLCVCRHAISPYSLFSYSLALLSLCSFQDAHKNRQAFAPAILQNDTACESLNSDSLQIRLPVCFGCLASFFSVARSASLRLSPSLCFPSDRPRIWRYVSSSMSP